MKQSMFAYCSREKIYAFFREAKFIEGMVARDGIEPPTPTLPSLSIRAVVEINGVTAVRAHVVHDLGTT
ncbi:MAG TPA: hypothetical protein VI306_22335 [Pyrinomonadaceae bacterium]